MSEEIPEGGRRRVAVIGGGISGLTAAFALTGTEALRARYEVTVYTEGWTLGGKGTSGRNAQHFDRNEEHGLHVWMGFYDNAFTLLRETYAEMVPPRDPKAFFRPAATGIFQDWFDGGWHPWPVTLPSWDALPGENPGSHRTRDLLPVMVDRLEAVFESARAAAGEAEHTVSSWFSAFAGRVSEAIDPEARGFALLRRAVAWIVEAAEETADRALAALQTFAQWFQELAERLEGETPWFRRLAILVDLAMAVLRGLVADHVLTRGFRSIDGEDLVAWLRRHGASDEAANSAVIQGVYGAVFAFVEGDRRRPSLAAGAGLRGMLRLFAGYTGALDFVPRYGFGETVFVPLYEVLSARGVRFEFFSPARRLTLDDDAKRVERIELGVRAHLHHAPYRPTVNVRGLPCFPTEPLYDQLFEAEELRRLRPNLHSVWPMADVGARTLHRGRDFDDVVFAVPPGAFAQLVDDLVARVPGWKEMVSNAHTVATLGVQLWMRPTLAELGWTLPTPGQSAYVPPLDTYGDMSDVIPSESWPDNFKPGSLAYLTGARPEAPWGRAETVEAQKAEDARVREMSAEWVRHASGHLWPAGRMRWSPDALDLTLLVAPGRKTPEARFEAQFFNASLVGSDRYVLTLPGTTQHRLAPGASGVENLALAGDWTSTPLDVGCMEAAVMSGLLAARALSGAAITIYGEEE